MQKPTNTYLRLATDAALALVARYLPSPWSLGDGFLFSNGRLGQWPEWEMLGTAEQQQIAKYLRMRPEVLADRRTFLKEAADSLSQKVRFFATADAPSARPECTFSPVSGKPIDQLLDELLNTLTIARPEKSLPVLPSCSASSNSVNLSAGRADFDIPASHLERSAAGALWPQLIERDCCDSVEFDVDHLLDLAGQIDRTGVSEVPYRQTLATLFEQLQYGSSRAKIGRCISIAAGPTQLLVAPTGGGKSVLSHVAALDLARRGIPTAIVLPDVKAVMRQAWRFEQQIAALGLPLTVAPLNSTARLLDRAAEWMKDDSRADAFISWAIDRMAYPCQLSAYGQSPESERQEPCFSLSQQIVAKKRLVACPFSGGCPKFDSFRKAASADILVVNHAAFLMGKSPIPFRVDNRHVHKMPVMELVFRRCAAVLIDEIDRLQKTAIDQEAGELQLSGRRRLSPIYELLTDFQEAKATDNLPHRLPVDAVRSKLHLTSWLAEEFADLINRGDLHWDERDSLRWSGSDDRRLAERLFGAEADALKSLEALFDGLAISDDAPAEELRRAVEMWSQRKLEDEPDTAELRGPLMSILSRWPRTLEANQRSWVADALIKRAILGRLEKVLVQLRPHLGMLEEHGLGTATRIRDELLGYAGWTPSPLGPLGRQVVGFAFRRHADEPGALYARALLGDPHGFIARLGEVSSLAWSGQKRIVIGLSATAWFPGSPQSHVLSPIWMVQPDQRDGVVVEAVTVQGRDGQAVRVSGESSQPRRMRRMADLAFSIWDQFLRDHLNGLASDPHTRDRAKALIVTGSYAEARQAAEALSNAMGGSFEANRRLRYVSREDAGEARLDGRAISPRDIEAFPKTLADILIAPLPVVARAHNIVVPGSTGKSAIASIFVLVRPVPPDDAARLLAHVSYETSRSSCVNALPRQAMESERRYAEKCLNEIRRQSGPFSAMPSHLRHAVLCDVMVELAQLAGRCRRGGTDVRLYLVDAAFQDENVGWDGLVRDAFARWEYDGDLPQMELIHRAFLNGLKRFAGVKEKAWSSRN